MTADNPHYPDTLRPSETSGNAEFGSVSTMDMCDLTGATFRQLDYWAQVGIISPEATTDGRGRPSDGPGSRRWWRRSQVPTIRALAALSAMTINAGQPAQLLRIVGQSTNPLGPWTVEQDGIRITVQITSRRRAAS